MQNFSFLSATKNQTWNVKTIRSHNKASDAIQHYTESEQTLKTHRFRSVI
ncbi:hypothetical protein NIES2104_28780 [Leptolyngbya sp. NIES-2104]|nr:hypothetical protein NIES2104_28780 [Leptolyngbya sp. NIES-2104]